MYGGVGTECTDWRSRKIQRYAIWDCVLPFEIMITPAVAEGAAAVANITQ